MRKKKKPRGDRTALMEFVRRYDTALKLVESISITVRRQTPEYQFFAAISGHGLCVVVERYFLLSTITLQLCNVPRCTKEPICWDDLGLNGNLGTLYTTNSTIVSMLRSLLMIQHYT